jgi:hypothetical protein
LIEVGPHSFAQHRLGREQLGITARVVVVPRHAREPVTGRFPRGRCGYHHWMDTAGLVIFVIAICIVAWLALRVGRRR